MTHLVTNKVLSFNQFYLVTGLLVLCSYRYVNEVKKLTELTEENCEVCVKFLNKFIESMDETTKSTLLKIEDAFRKFCKTAMRDDSRFCNYMGGLEESATGMVSEMSVSWSMPVDKICMKLYLRDDKTVTLDMKRSTTTRSWISRR